MNVKTISLVAGLIAALGSTAALAADEYTLNQNLPVANIPTVARVAVRIAAGDEYQRNQYPAIAPSDLQRAQVTAEAIEARKLGLISEGEGGAPTPTTAQAERIRLAGLNAVSHQVAAK